MKRLRWQILVIVLTLIAVGVLLISQQPSFTPISSQPASGGVYTEALIGSFERLNPLFDLNDPADRAIDRLIFSSLIRFDASGLPRPDLAESWGVSQDGKIYNFSLRQSAVWHDGQPVTSDDVVFTLSLLRSQFSAYSDDVRSLWDDVEINVLNEYTLQFVLPEPFAPFLDYLTFGILPKHLLEEISADQLAGMDFNQQPVGSGPYRFERLMTDGEKVVGIVLSVNESYYGQVPYIEQIVFSFYEDAQSALTAYQQGEALGISMITSDILGSALNTTNLSIYSSRLPKVSLVLLNLKNADVPYFGDKVIRRALMLGLNRQWMIDNLLRGQGISADSPILPGPWAYYAGLEQIEYDPDSAIELLKGAGYVISNESNGVRVNEDGNALSFTLLHPDDSSHTALAEAIQRDWEILGVQVDLEPIPYEQLLGDYLENRDYEAALVDLDLSTLHDPDPYPFWHQSEATGGQNYSQWDNRTASEYIEQARVLADFATRTRLYRNFQVVFEQELPALLLYYPVFSFGVDARVQGVQAFPLFDSSDRFNNISSWYLITRRSLEEAAQPAITP